jgi:hypothetical protein
LNKTYVGRLTATTLVIVVSAFTVSVSQADEIFESITPIIVAAKALAESLPPGGFVPPGATPHPIPTNPLDGVYVTPNPNFPAPVEVPSPLPYGLAPGYQPL